MMTGLADVVLAVHVLIAAFLALGFIVIPLGAWRRWRFVRSRGLRLAHLAGTLFVAVQALLGAVCPLTVWEQALRREAMEGGFIAYWAGRLLYYDIPLQVFSGLYLAAALAAVIAWYVAPPGRRRSHRAAARIF